MAKKIKAKKKVPHDPGMTCAAVEAAHCLRFLSLRAQRDALRLVGKLLDTLKG